MARIAVQGVTGNRILTAAACLLLAAPVQAQEPIGVVVSVRGQVYARSVDGKVRSLTRRMDLFEGDTLLTVPRGDVQVRLVDDATLSVGQDTELTFDSYRYDADPATPEVAAMTLRRGCMQSVSGRIGGADARVDTPYASINVNGMYSEQTRMSVAYAAVVDADALYSAAHQGSIVLSNANGSLRLGSGGSFDRGRVVASGMAPEGLASMPPSLSLASGRCTPVNNGAAAGPARADSDFSTGPSSAP